MERTVYNSIIAKSKYSSWGRRLAFLLVIFFLSLINRTFAQSISGNPAIHTEEQTFIFESQADDDKNLATEQNNAYADISITQNAFVYAPDHSVTNAIHNKEKDVKQLPAKKTQELAVQGQDKKKITYPQHQKKQDFFLPCSRAFYVLSSDRAASAVISNHYQKTLCTLWDQFIFRILHFRNTTGQIYTNPEHISVKITVGRGIRPPPLVFYM